MERILRFDMHKPVIIASAQVKKEPDDDADDGVRTSSDDTSKARVEVLFCTHAGRLETLIVALQKQKQEWNPVSLSTRSLGQVSAPGGPKAVTYLGENFVHIASAGGDSMVVQIPAEMDDSMSPAQGSQLTEIHRWPNLAPILDFVVDDGAGGDPSNVRSAQARIITCSGTGPTGSLRIVRNGAILQDLLSLSEAHVRRLWAVQDPHNASTKFLVLTYHTHSRILAVGSDGIEDRTSSFSALGLDSKSVLSCSDIGRGSFVIVLSDGVYLLSTETLAVINSWTPDSLPSTNKLPITGASTNVFGQVVLAFRFGHMVVLQASPNEISIAHVKQFDSEISSLDVSPLDAQPATYVAVAFWRPSIVQLLALEDLHDVTPNTLQAPQPFLVRSLLFHRFSVSGVPTSEPRLFVGLGDGMLNSYTLSLPSQSSVSNAIGTLEKRSTRLGRNPLHLRSFTTSQGLHAVFAACDRPVVLFSHGNGLNYSSIHHRDITDVCPFDYSTPEAGQEKFLVFAKHDELLISQIGQIHKQDISSVDLGLDNPMSITTCRRASSLAVVTATFLPEGRTISPIEGGKVLLFDDQTFHQLDAFRLELEERPNCIEYFERNNQAFLVVGTGYTFPDRNETTSGRLLIFHVSPKRRKLHLVCAHDVEGNVYDVASVGEERIVAAINASVIAFDVDNDVEDIEEQDEMALDSEENTVVFGSLDLVEVSKWACAFTATTLSFSEPNRLIVGDALRSVVVLSLDISTGKLTEMARDCDPYWTVSCEVVDQENEVYIGSDIAFNIWTCRRQKWTQSARERIQQTRLRESEASHSSKEETAVADMAWSHIMQRDAAFHYGDLVNKMKRGALVSPHNDVGQPFATPKIIFGTAAGALGVIAKLSDRAGHVLSQLSMRISQESNPIGGISSEEYV